MQYGIVVRLVVFFVKKLINIRFEMMFLVLVLLFNLKKDLLVRSLKILVKGISL